MMAERSSESDEENVMISKSTNRIFFIILSLKYIDQFLLMATKYC